MALFEYTCDKKHVTELLLKEPAQYTKCATCGQLAKRQISSFHFGNSPEFNKKWHPEEMNAAKDVKHWEQSHNKRVY